VDAEPLRRALDDADPLVRRNAAMAVARLGAGIRDRGELVSPLAENLYCWHHHVRGWCIEALQRLGIPAATQAALRYLMAARWDPTPYSGDASSTSKPSRRPT